MLRLANDSDVLMAAMGFRMHVDSPCSRCGTKAQRKLGFFRGLWVRRPEGDDGPGWAPICDLDRTRISRANHPGGGSA